MEKLLIGLLAFAAVGLWVWLSTAFGRIALGLHEARCPHCRQVNTLSVIDQGFTSELSVLYPTGEKRDTLVCNQCRKTCGLDEASQPKPEEPAPQSPVVA